MQPFGEGHNNISLSHFTANFTDTTSSTPPNNVSTPGTIEGDVSTIHNGQSGALKLYRITLSTIVLALTVFSMTSLIF